MESIESLFSAIDFSHPVAILVVAISLDRVIGDPRPLHLVALFGRWAGFLEKRLIGPDDLPAKARRWRGNTAVQMALIFPLVLILLPMGSDLWPLLAPVLLFYTIASRSLADHADAISRALDAGDLEQARKQLAMIVSRDTDELTEQEITAATVESILENGADGIYGALFWYAIAGIPGAVIYRMVNTLDAMWGYRTPRYNEFGRAAARLDDLLNWPVSLLTCGTYILIGNASTALHAFRHKPRWKSPNAGRVMATGAGALECLLGGSSIYQGKRVERPTLGVGIPPGKETIARAIDLVETGLWIWFIALSGILLLVHDWLLA
ncbi:MAG: cobalamin biosynthesis protein CobD [Magnetococcales bacterium]|nr:cobalamin biosynthesis protein CobD [Magnetococcales bacterium]